MPSLVASCTRGARKLPSQLAVIDGIGRPGDVVLARVSAIGAYPRVENLQGRDVRIRVGDKLVGVLGNRNSSTSIYGGLPEEGLEVRDGAPADLLAVGGVVGISASSPSSLGPATRLELLGIATDPYPPGEPIRLAPKSAVKCPGTPIVFVGGTSAEVGKTTFASALVNHLRSRHGVRVGVTKLAGTGRLRDLLTLADAGAHCSADFVDAGLATTYREPDEVVVGAARHLVQRLTDEGAQMIVAELGGDLWEGGIPALLRDPELTALAVALVIIPSDTMASLGAATWLRDAGIEIATAHGVPYRNVMAARERLRRSMGVVPVDPFAPDDLERLCTELLWPATERLAMGDPA
jgi:hypothetical protein